MRIVKIMGTGRAARPGRRPGVTESNGKIHPVEVFDLRLVAFPD
jgi:hypothetical protein